MNHPAKLHPCPFCGVALQWAFPVAYVHPVGKCILSGRNFDKGRIGQWNKRIPDATIARQQVMLDRALEAVADNMAEIARLRAALGSAGQTHPE